MSEPVEFGDESLKGWRRNIIFVLASLVSAMAVINLLGYWTHNASFIQTDATLASMKFNTALCLASCSFALIFLFTRKAWLVSWFAYPSALVSGLTLLEYIGGFDLRLDELFSKDIVLVTTNYPGRMGPLAASSLVFLSVGLIIAGKRHPRKWQVPAMAILAIIVMVISGVAALGYCFGIQIASGWGAYTRIAVQTACSLFCLAAGLLVWVRKKSLGKNYDLLPWISIAGAVTLMTMIAIISMATVAQLRQAVGWRKHSNEVIAAEEALLDQVVYMQRSVRAYVTVGSTNSLRDFREATNNLPNYFAPLVRLTVDNNLQKGRVRNMSLLVGTVLEYDDSIIEIYQQKGAEAVLKYEKSSTNRTIAGRLLDELKEFSNDEQKLLSERDTAEEKNYNNIGHLLTFGSILAAVLLIFAHLLTSREMRRRRAVEKVLRENEERFRSLVSGVKDYAIFLLNADGKVVSWNSGAQTITGYASEEIIGQNYSTFFTEVDQANRHPWDMLAKAWREGRCEEEGWRVKKNGSLFMASVLLTALRDERGALRGFSKITRDITERTRVEAQLRESEERFRRSFDDGPIGMALVSPAGRWLKVNRALCEMLGYQEQDLLNTDFQTMTHPEDLDKDMGFVQQVLSGQISSYQLEKRYYHKLGHIVFVALSVSLVRNKAEEPLYFVSQVENITERKRVEAQIAASLKEKDALLREIHHRVKNNMQVISSILKLQTNYIRDAQALEVFNDCQSRIRTMALVHEKLYRTEGLAQIDFKDYLSSLCSMLFRSLAGKGVLVRHEFQLEAVELDADTAIPVGLVANELITNCLKHAFKGRQKGFVLIVLRRYDASQCQLIVKDDGIGLGDQFLPEQTKSLGMRLIRILIEQIHGRLEFNSQNGAEFVVTFRNRAT